MLIVVDAFCLTEALETDSSQMLATLKKHCEDKIVTTDRIRKQYVTFSNLLPGLEELKAMPRPKAVERNAEQVGQIQGLRSQHDDYVKDAVGVKADLFITQNPLWDPARLKFPKGCSLRILSPAGYVRSKRQRK